MIPCVGNNDIDIESPREIWHSLSGDMAHVAIACRFAESANSYAPTT